MPTKALVSDLQRVRFDDIRAHPNWTQRQFAEQWGVTSSVVSQMIHLLYDKEGYVHPRSPSIRFNANYVAHKSHTSEPEGRHRHCQWCIENVLKEYPWGNPSAR